jgi:sterol desaturase/sphingolipid hydroxylase (fatty acid hydroxylase superfamily)
MDNLIVTLNDLTPVIIVLFLAVFMTLERFLPYFEHGGWRKKQRWHNLGIVGLAFLLNALLGGLIAGVIMSAQAQHFGLLHLILPDTSWLAIILGMFLVDLNSYAFHRLYHRIPLLWRMHRVHHADTELDATSALRMHPFEFIFQALTQVLVLPLLGVSISSFVLYFTFALPWFLLNHSNLKFPDWFERYGSWLLVTPNWHRVHHSADRPQTDSHYADVFTIWDRMFGTAGEAAVEQMTFGLEDFRENGEQTVSGMLKMPFKN